jgi:DtxR family Mn-dependent transcriptional regulator
MLLGEPKPDISSVVENYMQAFYKLKEQGIKLSVIHVAEAMGVSPATVVGTMKRLSRQELVTMSATKEIILTPNGEALGQAVVRRHRLAERMLVEILNLDWHKAHREAHRLEHAISPDVEERIAHTLNYPKTNPYGKPIPGYYDLKQPDKNLIDCPLGKMALIEQVPEDDQQLLKFFEDNGIKPGTAVKVKEIASYKGTVTVSVDDKDVILGFEVSTKIKIQT